MGKNVLILLLVFGLTGSLVAGDPASALKVFKDRKATWDDKRKAAEELADCGDYGLKQLIKLLDNSDRNTRLGARVGLLKAGDKALDHLLDLLKTGTNSQKLNAAEAIGDFGKRAASLAPELSVMMTSYNEQTQETARAALVAIGRELEVPEDRITLKSGRVLSGMVRKASRDQITFSSLQRTSTGTSIIQTYIKTSDIQSHKIAPKDMRPLLKAKVQALENRKKELATRGVGLEVEQKEVDGVLVNTIETDDFFIFSTAPDDLIRETAHRMIALVRAFEGHMNTMVAPGAQLKVYIAGSKEEYQAMQKTFIGRVMENPAFYIPEANMIWAFSDLEEYRNLVKDAKAHHDKLREENVEASKSLKEAERKLKVDVEELRQDVNRQIREVELKIKTAAVDSRLKSQARGELKRQVEELKREVNEEIKKVKAEIRKYKNIIKKNNAILNETDADNVKVLGRVAAEMFTTMSHESFHSFFNNRIRRSGQPIDNARWLNEGLAMYFESSAFDGVELIGGAPNKLWIEYLKRVQSDGKLMPLMKILKGNQDDFLVHENEHNEASGIFYLESWYLVRILSEMGKLSDPEKIADFIGDLAEDENGFEKAFSNLTGMSVDEAQKLMEYYLKVDDYESYRLLLFQKGKGPMGENNGVGRITMRTSDSIHIRLRNGEIFTCGFGDILNPGF